MALDLPASTVSLRLHLAVLTCQTCRGLPAHVHHPQERICPWQAAVSENGEASSPEASPDFERARSAAKALLETHRDCLPLWAAYARLESAASQHRCREGWHRRNFEHKLDYAGDNHLYLRPSVDAV